MSRNEDSGGSGESSADPSKWVWVWDNMMNNNQVVFTNDEKDVNFHPEFSCGTAVVRGKDTLQNGRHYFWEIKMLSELYGTDVMIGVGTDKAKLNDFAHRFVSFLGIDNESWGYSYRGQLQHEGRFLPYAGGFGHGSVIGVHIDMCAGTCQFYHNREALGIAFTGLSGRQVYPMISSTACRSSMRLLYAKSYLQNLQLDCLLRMQPYPELFEQLKSIPPLDLLAASDFWWLYPDMVRRIKEKELANDRSRYGDEGKQQRSVNRLLNDIFLPADENVDIIDFRPHYHAMFLDRHPGRLF